MSGWRPAGRPEHLREALEGSLRRLRLERIDLYQLHRIDPKVPAADQFGTLADLRQRGKIRHVGLSEVTVAQIEAAREVLPIVSVQNRYNLTDRRWEDVLDYLLSRSAWLYSMVSARPIGPPAADNPPMGTRSSRPSAERCKAKVPRVGIVASPLEAAAGRCYAGFCGNGLSDETRAVILRRTPGAHRKTWPFRSMPDLHETALERRPSRAPGQASRSRRAPAGLHGCRTFHPGGAAFGRRICEPEAMNGGRAPCR